MQRARAPTSLTYLERVNRVVDHVVTHLEQPLRLEAMARLAHLSPFHFHRVFQAIAGETLSDFVKRRRLERALSLMAGTKPASLTRIAASCGFSSSSDFSRSFRQRYGVPPRAFDLEAWRREHLSELQSAMPRVDKLPARSNPDGFAVRVRDLPARFVAYIRVRNPYKGDGVLRAAKRLEAWARERGIADRQWLGYQWENPEIVPLKDCHYHVAVESDRFVPSGEVGCFRFPAMTVAQVEIRGDVHLELRALQWLYGSWLPRSGYVPADQPGFEAWIGRPFAHGTSYFEVLVQLPVRR
ncbi:MAG: AraC family transcriptional regulator [Phycisphaerales bacterium]|nr:AraC family transcriptional regulator [Planctomycetota bacterium]